MSIETRVIKIVADQLGVKEDTVKPDSSFVDDLGADSLDTVELVMALEEEFECEIPVLCTHIGLCELQEAAFPLY